MASIMREWRSGTSARSGPSRFKFWTSAAGVCDHLSMAEYGNYCPVSMGTEVIADRWTPLILRELILGSTRFNDIARGLPGSPARCSCSA